MQSGDIQISSYTHTHTHTHNAHSGAHSHSHNAHSAHPHNTMHTLAKIFTYTAHFAQFNTHTQST